MTFPYGFLLFVNEGSLLHPYQTFIFHGGHLLRIMQRLKKNTKNSCLSKYAILQNLKNP